MKEAARAVEEIAGLQREFACRRTGSVLAGIERLPAQRQDYSSVVEGPQLRPRNLQDEHVMAIEMGLEPLGVRRRKVDVRLKMAAERLLDGTAQRGKRCPALMQLRE